MSAYPPTSGAKADTGASIVGNLTHPATEWAARVTAERIRDKVAASKRKGLWVGGMVPLGYELKDGTGARASRAQCANQDPQAVERQHPRRRALHARPPVLPPAQSLLHRRGSL